MRYHVFRAFFAELEATLNEHPDWAFLQMTDGADGVCTVVMGEPDAPTKSRTYPEGRRFYKQGADMALFDLICNKFSYDIFLTTDLVSLAHRHLGMPKRTVHTTLYRLVKAGVVERVMGGGNRVVRTEK